MSYRRHVAHITEVVIAHGTEKVLIRQNEEVLIFERPIFSKIRSGGPQTAQYKEVLIYRGYTVVVNSGHTVYISFNEKKEKAQLSGAHLSGAQLSVGSTVGELNCR